MREKLRGPLYSLQGVSPKIGPDVFIAPTAAVIGDVEIGARSSVWFSCVLRGDVNYIRVGTGTNIQDGTIVHVVSKKIPAIIGNDITIGHACIIHACTLKDHAFVGMGATVLDGAVIEEGGMLAAGALLTPGKVIGPNELWGGSPARLWRVLSPEQREGFRGNAPHYVGVAARFLDRLEDAG
jgi:carbonic anhydrase/acetyltransferase-like protein (isoleucine patch superfamily)